MNKKVKDVFWKTIYSIWSILAVINSLLLMVEIFAWDMFTLIIMVVWLIYPWFIAAYTSKDRKAMIRFLIITSIEIVYRASVAFINVSFTDSEMVSIVSTLYIIHNVFLFVLLVIALRVRKDVVEKSILMRNRKNNIIIVSNSETEKQNQWVENQKKKQTQKSKIDFEAVEKENIVKTETVKTVVPEVSKTEAVSNHDVNTDFVEKLDINQCSEEDFLTLPGMSLLNAKRAVELRETQGDYKSIDDFVARNNIKPHFMVRMEPMIMVMEKKEKKAEAPRRGRMLDL